jgi:type I restriction enzyme M protein
VTEARALFDSLWAFYDRTLSAEGVSPFEYVEQLTYLLFLKIDHERSERDLNPVRVVDKGLDWPGLAALDGDELERQYAYILEQCGKTKDIRNEERTKAVVFRKAKVAIRNPAKLRALIADELKQRKWSNLGPDTLGELYRLLLVKASANFNIEAGQTLTPEPFVSAVIDCLCPGAGDTVFDPACGTGALLIAGFIAMAADSQARPAVGVDAQMAKNAITGYELDERMCRLATMHVLLALGRPFSAAPPIEEHDTLAAPSNVHPTLIVCNPPFRSTAPKPKGRKGLITDTNNIQLNFLQHIATLMANGARAAVFVPDNVLFASDAAQKIREWLIQNCNVHTLLRLPTGVFERSMVKSNVLFFEKKPPRADGFPATERLHVYDARTGRHFQATQNPLKRSDLDDFVSWYHSDRAPDSDIHACSFTYGELTALPGLNIDIVWPGMDVNLEIVHPRILAREIADALDAASQEFTELAASLPEVPDHVERDE